MKEGAFYPWLVQQKPLALPPGSLLFAGAGDFDEIGREFLGHFVNLTRLQRGETILDVGCGVGRMAKALTQYVSPKAQYWGVDVGRSAVDWCQSHLTPAFPNFHFQHIDVQSRVYNPEGRIPADRFRLPYGDATFDFAFLTSVFTHLLPADAAQYLREVGRVLKPDGRCLATFFLVNETTRSALDREGGSIRFPNALDGCWVSSTEAPEAAVALPETAVRGWSMEAGMAVVEPIRYGS